MIPAERAHLHVAAITHPGMSGKNNEDRYAASAYQLGGEKGTPSVLAIVSDGIGGHRAGEVAAEIAVETISQVLAESTPSQPAQALRAAVIQASQAIYTQSESDPNLKGMGATCACGWVIGDRLYTASVGDSRIYLIREGVIRQLSIDHTWIQEALDVGAITPDEARGHPNAHVIRRYLGSRQTVVPDIRLRLDPEESDAQAEANQGLRLQPGDQILLCSDGLTDLVRASEIQGILKGYNLEDALDRLVNLANQRGGHDNITIVAMQVPEGIRQAAAVPAVEGGRRLNLRWACAGVLGLLLFATLALTGLYWFVGDALPTPWWQAATTAPATQPLFEATTTASPGALTRTPTSTRTPRPATATLTASPTPLPFTLTPWPTNTRPP